MGFQTERASESDYRLLGLSAKASRQDVKSAYRRLAKTWHPDRFQQHSARERDFAEEKFKALTVAYRRIAGGWLEEERTEKKVPHGDAKTSRSPEEGARQPRQPSAVKRTGNFSWIFVRRSFLATGLSVLALVALLAIRSYLSVVEPGGTSSSGPVSHNQSRVSVPDTGKGSGSKSVYSPEDPARENAPSEDSLLRHQPSRLKPTAPESDSAPEFISIGSTQDAVMKIQGPPQHVRGQTWVYGVSELGFKDGRVVRYNNFDGNLKVRVLPSRPLSSPVPATFTLGSSADEVLTVQGTPSRMERNRWLYGFSEVRFKEGRVEEYDNFFGDLKIRLIPEEAAGTGNVRRPFSVGSSKSEVLLTQGTPTSIRGNLWYYQMSSILFRKGKVHYVFNSSGNLHYVPKEELTRNE